MRRALPFALLALSLTACPGKQDSPAEPPAKEDEGVVCTMDAKLCPDGSAVGRQGPNCEFPPCPGEAPASE